MSSSVKRQVVGKLKELGFGDTDIRSAINECGYNADACVQWIAAQKKKPRLRVGMEVWVFSREDNDWAPGHVVSITKQLLSTIFNGNDFRWLEKDSDLYRIQEERPAPLNPTAASKPFGRMSGQAQGGDDEHDDTMNDPYSGNMQQEYTAPRPDEIDYYVTFSESVLGLELYSDEDGFNCIVGRCVSSVARDKVTPGSQIVQVNDRWLANYRFEEIRDAVKQAARQPPLNVTFRIKKSLLKKTSAADNEANNTANNHANNGYVDQSQSPTSPDTQNPGYDDDRHKQQQQQQLQQQQQQAPPKQQRNNNNQNNNEALPMDEEFDFVGTLAFEQCDKLQIGDHVDHRDDVGRFLLATIVDKGQDKVKIHYEGWNSKWDTWCDYKTETHRFAAPRSISRKPNTRFRELKIRDYVDINPLQRHRGWRVGQIRRMDKYSGQAQIVYKEEGQEFLYWAHLNNPEEIAPFMTRAAEQIALQQKLAEYEEEQQQPQAQAPPPPPSQQQQPQPPAPLQAPPEQAAPGYHHHHQHSHQQQYPQQQYPQHDADRESYGDSGVPDAPPPPQAQAQAPHNHAHNGSSHHNTYAYSNTDNLTATSNQHGSSMNNFIVSPTADTAKSVGFNSNVGALTVHSYGNGSAAAQPQQAQPPPANHVITLDVSGNPQRNSNRSSNNGGGVNNRNSNPNNLSMNMNGMMQNQMMMMNGNGSGSNMHMQNNSNGNGGGGSNLHLYNQIQPNAPMMNGGAAGGGVGVGGVGVGGNSMVSQTGHQKSKSRVIPTTVKTKKLPPKPAAKKRNKGVNRSRTQPLPDNQNNPNMSNAMNAMNNGYNNYGGGGGGGMQMQPNNGYQHNNNSGSHLHMNGGGGGGGMNMSSNNNGGGGGHGSHVYSLNFNAPQYPPAPNKNSISTANFTYGNTTYTAQMQVE